MQEHLNRLYIVMSYAFREWQKIGPDRCSLDRTHVHFTKEKTKHGYILYTDIPDGDLKCNRELAWRQYVKARDEYDKVWIEVNGYPEPVKPATTEELATVH